jgi:tetratricopeptide (TPR) repeat protein
MHLTRFDLGVAVLLACGTVAAFSPAFQADFIGLDDPVYVTLNRHVRTGLSRENVAWAWTTTRCSNWHPLTWLSLQLDATLSGPGPLGFHTTNVALHVANAILLYLALCSLTGWRPGSAFVAALFALHPLRVESVVWVTERKDVLSTFFGLLALWAYARYAKAPSILRYLPVLLALALSLLAKPMFVTLPFLLLLLDWWPLRRTQVPGAWRRAAVEKIPLFILCLLSSVITLQVQKQGGAVATLGHVNLLARVNTALVAFATYLGLAIWPFQLAPYYPYPANGDWPAERVAVSILVIAGLTGLAVWQRRRRPYLLAGWLWYVGTLIPVVGLVQVGGQAYADRYTYVPLIGGAIAVVGLGADLASRVGSRLVVATACAVLVGLGAATWSQATYWHDDLTLWPRTLAVTGDNAMAESNLGVALQHQKRYAEATEHYARAVKIMPKFGEAHYNLGTVLALQHHEKEAIPQYLAALEADPRLAQAHNDLGAALGKEGRINDAERHYREALKIEPELALAHRNLGSVLDMKGRGDEALAEYVEAIRLNPTDGTAHGRLGIMLAQRGQPELAVEHLRRAVELEPASAAAHFNLGIGLQRLEREGEAADCYRRALELEPNGVRERVMLATALHRLGNTAEAENHYREALKLDPRWPQERRQAAWIMATSPNPRERDGRDAVLAAESACNALHPTPAPYLDVLAAAYAEAGRFSDATATAQKALAAAEAASQSDVARAVSARLALYRERRPFHRPPPDPR